MRPHRNVLIVLAAGLGKRMGKKIPKMLLPVCGRPLLFWTLKNIEESQTVDAVILTVTPEYRKQFESWIRRWKFKKPITVIDGGAERQDSTRIALQNLPPECLIVGIHDGARAFVTPQLLKMVFSAAQKHGAALLAVPSKDTVKVVKKNGFIQETIAREQCWSAQTPQVFRKKIAEKIHAAAFQQRAQRIYTDDASMAEALGINVKIVPSTYENIKVTTPEDLILAETILKKRA